MPRRSWKTDRVEIPEYKNVKVTDYAGYAEDQRGIRITAWPKLSAFEQAAVDAGHKEPVYIDVLIPWRLLAETVGRHWKIQRARRHK